MKLENYGYKEEKMKIRTMSMAEMRIGIVQELLRKNHRFVNIRLVNITSGDVDSFRSTEDFLMADFNEAYEIDLISVKEINAYNEKENRCEIRIVIVIRETPDAAFTDEELARVDTEEERKHLVECAADNSKLDEWYFQIMTKYDLWK